MIVCVQLSGITEEGGQEAEGDREDKGREGIETKGEGLGGEGGERMG